MRWGYLRVCVLGWDCLALEFLRAAVGEGTCRGKSVIEGEGG